MFFGAVLLGVIPRDSRCTAFDRHSEVGWHMAVGYSLFEVQVHRVGGFEACTGV